MSTIIDGYNVLRGCGFIGGNVGPGTLERARGMFVGLIAGTFSEEERRDTSIVFDSALRLPELPDHYLEKGISIHFASGHKDADEMIIEMIQQHSHPKSLLIVSSDHQIQDAAKHRRATAIDSEVWYEKLVASKQADSEVQRTAAELKLELQLQLKRSDQPVSASETEKWVQAFIADGSNSKAAPVPIDIAPTLPSVKTPESKQDSYLAKTAGSQTNPASLQKNTPNRKLQSTSFGEIAQAVEKAPKTENSRNTASGRNDGNNPSEDGVNELSKVKLTDLDNQDLPELEIGKAVAGSALKHTNIDPANLDQWLDEFDSQFESSELSGVPVPNKNSGKPNSRRSVIDPNFIPETVVKHSNQPAPEPPQPAEDILDIQDVDKLMDELDPPPNVDAKQVERWNRQIRDTSLDIFPPGYGEDILFSETFEKDDRIKKRRK